MGYKNAPAHYCHKIDTLMQEEGIKDSVTFVDDILTYGNSWTEYVAA